MPIPPFDGYGLLPDAVHECSLAEAGERFGVSAPKRTALWRSVLEAWSAFANAAGFLALYVDGSFVTDRLEPGDVDVLVELRFPWDQLPPGPRRQIGDALKALEHLMGEDGLHVYVYWAGLRFANLPGCDMVDSWRTLSVEEAHSRGLPDGTRRGILRVSR